MRSSPLPLALLLAGLLVAGCLGESPTEPAATAELVDAASLGPLAAEKVDDLKKKKKKKKKPKRKVVTISPRPDGTCPPTFRPVFDRRGGTVTACTKIVPPLKKRPRPKR